MKLKLLIFFLLIFKTFVTAQSPAEAEKLFNQKRYSKAKELYESLIKKSPNDALYSYRLGRCCYELKDWTNTIKNFELSVTKFPLSQWYLAEAYFNEYRFEEAAATFESFMLTLQPDDKRLAEIEIQKKRAELAQKLLNRVVEIVIFDSVVTDKNSFLKKYEISPELGSLRQAVIKTGNNVVIDKITYTTQRGDRQIFSDTLNGQTDLFSTYRLLDSWSDRVSVSDTINTSANENYPFLLPDGLTLYFSSDCENSIGGYDIFMTKFSSVTEGFVAPENLGFPFNSPANDYMMAIDEGNKSGWFATDRNQPTGKVTIYRFEYNEDKKFIKELSPDSLRQFAKLKMYKKAAKKQFISGNSGSEIKDDIQKNFSLILTDEIIYTCNEDFKNPKALSLWIEYQKMNIKYDSEVKNLNELRQKYDSEQTKNVDLIILILNKESELNGMNISLQEKLLNIRNEEILFIGSKNKN